MGDKLSVESNRRPILELQIRMVAGYREVAERKEILVAGAGFEPATFGL